MSAHWEELLSIESTGWGANKPKVSTVKLVTNTSTGGPFVPTRPSNPKSNEPDRAAEAEAAQVRSRQAGSKTSDRATAAKENRREAEHYLSLPKRLVAFDLVQATPEPHSLWC